MVTPMRKEFNNGTVVVTIPTQAKPIDVKQIDLPAIELMPAVPIGFHPFRPVINLVIVDSAGNEMQALDPSIEIRIRYTADDMKKAEAVRRALSLGFWDGKKWIRFTPNKHNFRLVPDTTPGSGGWGIVEVSHWGDPPHAWGT